MVKNENFIVIQGFMINELNLKGNELIIYAVIYGFSQTTGQQFTGSLQYLMNWTNSTKRNVINNLQSLMKKGLIEKEEVFVNNIKFCKYFAKYAGGEKNSPVMKKNNNSGEKNSPGGEQSIPNNIDNNIINITTIKTENPFTFYENNFGLITPVIADKINSYIEDGIEDKLLIAAMQKAIDNNVRKWSYVQTILNDCINNNIKTLHDFEIQQKEYKDKKATKTTPKKEVEYNTDFSEYDKYVN